MEFYLVLHITGFTMMAGGILAYVTIYRRLGKYLLSDRSRAMNMLDGIAALPRLIGIGGLLILVTGIGMLFVFKGSIAQMLWFRIKMILVVLVILNGSLIIRRKENRLKDLLVSNGANGRILALRRQVTIYHAIELLLFLLIFILSVFQF